MNRAKELADIAAAQGFLKGSVTTVKGDPRIVGPVPWSDYRGDLGDRVGRPDLEGLAEWLAAQENVPSDVYGPLTLWRVYRELGLINGGT